MEQKSIKGGKTERSEDKNGGKKETGTREADRKSVLGKEARHIERKR